MDIEVDYKEPKNLEPKEELTLEDEIGDLIEEKPEIKQEIITEGVDENAVFRENLEGIRCVLMDETNYKPIKGALHMIQLIFNDCIKWNMSQKGCVFIGIKRKEDCYLHFSINPGKPSYLILKNST